MKEKTIKQQLKDLEDLARVKDRQAASNRARSITIGTAFGGTTEINVRGDDGTILWSQLQPVEVVELIHQLCANIGCLVALKPRNDFASWRDWRVTDEERERLNGWVPFVNDMSPYNQLGARGMDPEILKVLEAGGKLSETGGGAAGKQTNKQPKNVMFNGRSGELGQPGASVFNWEEFNRSKQNAVATEKPKNRRTAKRATKAS